MTFRRLHPALLATTWFCCAVLAARAQQGDLNLRYVNGIAVVAGNQIVTVEDVRRAIGPLRPLDSGCDGNSWLEQLQEHATQFLVDRALVVQEFHRANHRIPAEFVDHRLAETIMVQFCGDRSKYLAYLRSRGISAKVHRRELEADIIYDQMRQQHNKQSQPVTPGRIVAFYNENKQHYYREETVHLRLIQLDRAADETDEAAKAKMDQIVAELARGADFGDLARKYSRDSRRRQGGDWGWQRRSELRKEYGDAIFALTQGEPSRPFVRPEGVFLFLVEERRAAGIPSLAELQPEIERALAAQGSRKATERWLGGLRGEAYLKYFF